MEQRPLRLGDTLDDYCPRERRITNHAVVAMIGDNVKQTRCTTCDSEHAYKGGAAPRRRKKETRSALYKEVLAGMPETESAAGGAPAAPAHVPPAQFESAEPEHGPDADVEIETPSTPHHEAQNNGGDPDETPRTDIVEDGAVHRRLIRATLPRVEGQKDERRGPDFTIRQSGVRGPKQFGGTDPRVKNRGGRITGGTNGNRAHGAPRFAGSRAGAPHASGRGGSFHGGQSRRGKKRSR